MWIPEGYDGPRPGYPWIEVGRMMLPGADRTVGAPFDRPHQPDQAIPSDLRWPVASDTPSTPGGAVAPTGGPDDRSTELRGQPLPRDSADFSAVAAGDSRVSVVGPDYPDIGAAMMAWDSLSDARAASMALDAISRRNPRGRTIADRNPGSYQVATDLSGYATFYNLPGSTTSTGQPFDPNGMTAAMTRDRAPPGTNVQVRLQGDPSTAITVQVNDTGPFARDAAGRPLRPLRPDPDIVIDLTPHAFDLLTNNNRQLGRVPVIVTVPDHD